MTSQVLSSSLTFWYKVLFPILWIGGFSAATAFVLSTVAAGKMPVALAFVFPAALAIGTFFIYRYCICLKRVILAGSELLISNFSREIRVPLSSIVQVKATRMVNPPHITLVFDADFGFGRSIIFMPKRRFVWPFQEHPMAGELRDLVNRQPNRSLERVRKFRRSPRRGRFLHV